MCWPHVHRNIVPRLKHLKTIDKNLAANVLSDIEDLQWSALNKRVFLHAYELLEKQYLEKVYDDILKASALAVFFGYFRSVWVESEESNWFEGAHAFASSNNQGIEGKNKEIKAAHTFRKRMPLGSFIDCMLNMVHEWSLEDSSLLSSARSQILFSKPNGLSLRTDGYTWYKKHSHNSNYVKINEAGRKTVSDELGLGKVDAIWAVTSSYSNTSVTLKEHVRLRMKNRVEPDCDSFEEYMDVRKCCWIIEERNGEFYCDCPLGMKGRMDKVRFKLLRIIN